MSVDHTLSDLFFNYDNPIKYPLITPERVVIVTDQEYYDSVLKSANDFIVQYEGILNCDIPSAEELARDFMERV